MKMKRKNVIKCLCVLAASTMLVTACAHNIEENINDNLVNITNDSFSIEDKNNASTDNNIATNIPSKISENSIRYASQFTIEEYENGYKHIHILDGADYVLVPEGEEETDLGIEKAVILKVPVSNIYLAATSAMDLFDRLDSLESIIACSTKADDYSIRNAVDKIENGDINYVGKYSAPDYEALLSMHCNLALESTMINHSPEIKEQLEKLGIPVMIERSSYEESPLGRLEWIKLYGALLSKSDEAEDYFNSQVERLKELKNMLGSSDDFLSEKIPREDRDIDMINGKEKPTVVFFYISSNGYVNVRKPGDYVTTMIEMAGGKYALDDIKQEEENALSTMNVNWETFYTCASGADIIIYNGTIDGGMASLEDLVGKNELFNDFDAVKNGRVYCTNMNMFQCSSDIAGVIVDLYHIVEDDGYTLEFFSKLY